MPKKIESRIVLALDRMSKERALKIAEEASGLVWGFKVHDLLFHYGAEIVYELSQRGKVIADARLWGAVSEIQRCSEIYRTAGADIITMIVDPGYVIREDAGAYSAGIGGDEWCSECEDVSCKSSKCRGFGWRVDGARVIGGASAGVVGAGTVGEGATFNALRDGEKSLHVYGNSLITSTNFITAIEEANEKRQI